MLRKIKTIFIGFVLIATVLLGQHLNSYAQAPLNQQLISLTVRQKSLHDVLKLISGQTGYIFSYNPQVVNADKKITITINNKPLPKVLEQLLGAGITYKQQGKYIILTKAADIVTLPKSEPVVPLRQVIDTNNVSSLNVRHDSLLYRFLSQSAVENEQLYFQNMLDNYIIKEFDKAKLYTEDQPVQSQTTNDISEDEANNINTKPWQISLIYPIGTDGAKSKDNAYQLSLNILSGITGSNTKVEIGGLFNFSQRQTQKLQIAGLFNFSQQVQGLQIAGIGNLSSASTDAGLQSAGIFNINKGDSKIQIALFNQARKSKIQLGFVNICDTADIMIGFINIERHNPNKLIEWEFGGTGMLGTYIALRSGKPKLYGETLISFDFRSKIFGLGFGLGTSMDLKYKFGLDFDLIYNNLFPLGTSIYDFGNLIQLRSLVNYKIKKVRIFAGPSINFLIYNKQSTAYDEEIPRGVLTLSSLGTHYIKAWISFSAGIRLRH